VSVVGGLLSDGAGVYDVCEKEPSDAMEYLTPQQCEDITASAQVRDWLTRLCSKD